MQSARRVTGVPASRLVLDVLDRTATWTDADRLAASLELPPGVLESLLDGLEAHDLIEVAASPLDAAMAPQPVHVETGTSPPFSPWAAWSPAAWYFHRATRDVAFTRRGRDGRAATPPRPPVVPPPSTGEVVPLPLPRVGSTLRDALQARRTHRRFTDAPVSGQDIGTLLGATFGVQAWAHAEEGPLALKTAPSGGARHSLEAYAWVRRGDDVAPGLYHYRADCHALSRLSGREFAESVTTWLPAQTGYEEAPLVVVLASELARVAWRYQSARAYRVVLIEAGHLAQTFCLVAAAIGLAPFCTAALADSAIEAALGLDGDASPVIYAMGAGQPVPGQWRPHDDRPTPRLEPTRLGQGW